MLPFKYLEERLIKAGKELDKMSNSTNDKLLDDVQDLMSYWEGTLWERVMQRDIDANDLEALRYHVSEAYKEMALQETQEDDNDVY